MDLWGLPTLLARVVFALVFLSHFSLARANAAHKGPLVPGRKRALPRLQRHEVVIEPDREQADKESFLEFAKNISVEGVLQKAINERMLEKQGLEKTHIITSWVLLHRMGNYTDALSEPGLTSFVTSIRDAMADSLIICRSAVEVIDVKAVNVDLLGAQHAPKFSLARVSFLQGMVGVVGGIVGDGRLAYTHLNLTQFKASFEVRIFPMMSKDTAEILHHMEGFQSDGPFMEMSRLVNRAFLRNGLMEMDQIVLDDVGVSTSTVEWRKSLNETEMDECREEVALLGARLHHQYIVILCLSLVAFTTCAGSALFAMKAPSMIPSRLNPLGLGGYPYQSYSY